MPGWPEIRRLLDGSALDVAPRLLGARLTVADVCLRITEVEAYEGADDPGSHAFRGETRRNRTMFGPAGRLYCYQIYGMHVCANVVCGPVGRSSAVLLRAGEVLQGVDVARSRRGDVPDAALARGPANLVSALGLTLADDGFDLEGHLELGSGLPAGAMEKGPRVGLRHAAERPWRFWIAGDRTVSAYRAAKAMRPSTGVQAL